MENYIQAEDYELWMLIMNGPLVPTKILEDGNKVSKEPSEFDAEDYKMMEKNAKAKKLLYFGLGPDEYTRISECTSAKDIWDALQVAHEGTNQVKQSRIELLMRKYELFEMGDRESVMDMYTRFTHITNELRSLGKSFTIEELVRKILRILPHSWEAKVTAIQEAKEMNKITLDELIGNLQTYELRKNSQQKEETKKDRGLALKALEDDDSDLDEEEVAMITRKFKKFFKKVKENNKKKDFGKSRNTSREQFSGCFKCGKLDHIVKNCPLLREEQDPEHPRKQGRKQGVNNSGKRFSKAMLAAWGDSTDDEEESENEEVAVALMANSDTDSDAESENSLTHLKNKVCDLNKATLEELVFTIMDISAELKRDVRNLELENETLKMEKLEIEKESRALLENIDVLKETLIMKEETCSTNLTKLEKESLELKEKVDSLLTENQRLLEKIEQMESDLTANKLWNRSSRAFEWLNTHRRQNKRGLGFTPKRMIYPVNRKYVGLSENIVCFHCGKTGHYRYTCPSRKYAIERNAVYVRQIWVRKDDICMSKGMGPKWIWVPKTNL